MNPFGDGSDGALDVASGTYVLQPDRIYNFTSINIAAAATLTVPANSTGSVLYLRCQGICNIAGNVVLSGRTLQGQYSRSVELDGVTYSYPSTANGGAGGHNPGNPTPSQGQGFGGGGDGGQVTSAPSPVPAISAVAGRGATGGSSYGVRGLGGNLASNAPNSLAQESGQNASTGSAGGGGSAWGYYTRTGSAQYVMYATGGAGATGYGQNGGAGSVSWSYQSGSGSATIFVHGGGGGGGGGAAGRSGLHLVIKARQLVLTGSIDVSGTNGQKGGQGGPGAVGAGVPADGCGGGGGGGGNSGNVYLYVGSLSGGGSILASGGTGGGGGGGSYAGSAGSNGSNGQVILEYIPQIKGNLLLSGSVVSKSTHYTSIGGLLRLSESFNVSKVIAAVPGKEFVYRVYRSDGTYVGIWPDVASELQFTQRINTPGTTTNVRLARSANTTKENREPRITQDGVERLTEDGDTRSVVFRTNNTVGEDTDLDLNYRVDIDAHYGGFEERVTQDGETRITEDGDTRIAAVGAPLGVTVFSGFILDYEAVYGESEYVDVTLASHGHELSHEIIKTTGGDTTRTFSSTSHDTIIKEILDTDPGTVTYSADSIEPTGETITQTFRLNTKLEGIEAVYNQTAGGWFWYVGVGDNYLYLRQRSVTPDHIFVFGKHIAALHLKRSMEHLRNVVYFVGGDTGGGSILYKKYDDSTSISNWRQGLHRIVDRRYTLPESAARRADKEMAEYKEPIYTTTLEVLSEVYDIETIRLGQIVGFANFGNFVDELALQIVSISYTPHKVTLQLGGLLDRQSDIIEGIEEGLQDEQFIDIPNAPS